MIEGIQPRAGFAERSAVVLVGELETLKIQPPNIKLLEKSLIWLCSSSKQQATEKTLEHSLPRWLNGHGVARTQFEQQSKQQHVGVVRNLDGNPAVGLRTAQVNMTITRENQWSLYI
ncbi:hypothetical protein PABG_04025 [Paracoccidioides brasiliensis Pb03]|nr:hypothetical protein PABG_04025 [Paracoccidioides brasiliensis Pb03]